MARESVTILPQWLATSDDEDYMSVRLVSVK